MAIHILANAEQIGTQSLFPKDYVIYEEETDIGTKTWTVVLIDDSQGALRTTLGMLSSKANALTFALAHQSTGWEDDGVLCRVAREVVRYCSEPGYSDALERLALAVRATVARRPRALVVVDRGTARVHTSDSVDAVVVDLDMRREFSECELVPVHPDFEDLLNAAGVDWPLSQRGIFRGAAWRKSA